MECGLGDIIIIMPPQGSGCHGVCRCAEGGCINMSGGGGDGSIVENVVHKVPQWILG